MNSFLVYFPRARLVRINTSCHLVASSFEVGIAIEDIYEIEELDGWKVMPSTAGNLNYLVISSYEDN